RVLLLKAPPGDETLLLRAMFVGAEVDDGAGEVAHTFVEQARHHRRIGQLDHAVVREYRRALALHAATSTSAGRGWFGAARKGLQHLDVDVLGKRRGLLEECAVGVKPTAADAAAHGELRH